MNKKLYKLMNWPQIEGVTYKEESNPFEALGKKILNNGTLFQFFYPEAKSVNLLVNNTSYKMELADDLGFYALLLPEKKIDKYEYEILTKSGKKKVIKDAYAFDGYFIDEKIATRFNAGTLYDSYNYLGSHETKINGVSGVKFAVWAPSAIRVSVIGSFNDFDSAVHQMKKNNKSGIFELFIPGAKANDLYKYEIRAYNSQIIKRLDPYAYKTVLNDDEEFSVVTNLEYKFSDSSFVKSNKIAENDRLSICEINIDSFINEKDKGITYSDIADRIIAHVNEYGYTAVELLPLLESKNKASMGYHTNNYFSINSRYGSIDDFMCMIDKLHSQNIGVYMDWTCAYFDSTCEGMQRFDGTALFEHLDDKKGKHPIWGTNIFNYGRPEVVSFLISNAMFLINVCHIDGLCIDSLSTILYLDYERNDGEWIANQYGGNENIEGIEFIKHLNSIVKKNNKRTVMIARERAAYPKITDSLDNGGLGFDYKFNNGFMDDYLNYIKQDPLFRAPLHNDLTFSMIYQYSENYINGISHDYILSDSNKLYELMPGDEQSKLANLRLTYSYLFVHPGKKILSAFLEIGGKNIHDKGLKKLVSALNKLYYGNKALSELDDSIDGFEWINCLASEACTLSFMRKAKEAKDSLFVVCNFAGIEQDINVGTSLPGKYKEIFNSDDIEFGGNKKSRTKTITVSEYGEDGREFSFKTKLAPLSLAVYKFIPFTEKEKYQIEKKKEAAIANTKAAEYKELSINIQKEYEAVKKNLDECISRLKELELQIKDANDNEAKELAKAKKALEESK